MRSLVFVPPPTLSQFATTATHPHSTIPLHPLPRPARIIADETRPIPNTDAITDEVPDSVDPHYPTVLSQEEESIARSEVPDAPEGVPWEVLHRDAVPAAVAGDASRAQKRVRIRSPVLVIETPERCRLPFGARNTSARGDASKDGQQLDRGVSPDADADAEKSRVVLGDESDDDDDDDDEHDSHNSNLSRTVDETNAVLPAGTLERSIDAGADQSSHIPEQSDRRYDLSLLAARPVPRTAAAAAAASIQADTTSTFTVAAAGSQSASSLQIRPPVPAAMTVVPPQATCRFTFFSKRPAPRASTSFTARSAVERQPAAEQPSMLSRDDDDAQPHLDPRISGPRAAIALRKNGCDSSIRATLPPMNAFEASYDSLPFRAASDSVEHQQLEQHSILPPPTLHFTLSSITPISRILAHPLHYISSTPRSSAAATGAGAVGGISSRVNLLVVVRDVGEVMRVRSKFAVDPPAFQNKVRSARGDVGRGTSRAFDQALREHDPSVGSGDGKTERVELVVMDGQMSPIRRLVDSESAGWSVVEEPLEKALFTVVLWGQLARDWTTDAPPSDPNESGSGTSTTLTPTALQPGDIVALTNLSLSPRLPPAAGPDAKRRLGTGLPAKIALTAHASAANRSAVELCYRCDLLDPVKDARRNFDDDVAAFDLRSRRVFELARLWRCHGRV